MGSTTIETIPLRILVTTYIAFIVLIIVGHLRDIIVRILYPRSFSYLLRQNGIEPIYTDFESFFTRRLYTRIRDCWNRPIVGVPSKFIYVMERKSVDENVSFRQSGKILKALNVGSYNYLGLARPIRLDSSILFRNERLSDAEIHQLLTAKDYKTGQLQKINIDSKQKNIEVNFIEEFSAVKFLKDKSQLFGREEPYFKLSAEKWKIQMKKSVLVKIQDPRIYLKRNFLKIFSNPYDVACLFPTNYPAPHRDIGYCHVSLTLENVLAEFLQTEACMVFSMGFGTNSSTLPIICTDDTLVLSDELNHTSIIYGLRMANCVVKTFQHNSMKDLEAKLKMYISEGIPVTHRQWKRVFVVVEGIYSMEGDIAKLDEIMELKKKYKFYLFVDEAHSIGALGRTGRGVSEYFGLLDEEKMDQMRIKFTHALRDACILSDYEKEQTKNQYTQDMTSSRWEGSTEKREKTLNNNISDKKTRESDMLTNSVQSNSRAGSANRQCDLNHGEVSPLDYLISQNFNENPTFTGIDILMGTFTKSFGGFGGYIAGSKTLINYLRTYSDFALFGEQISPIVSSQILNSLLQLIMNPQLARNLKKNTHYIRKRLNKLGFIVFGDKDSPIVPLMIFNPSKIADFSRMCLERRVAVVVVGYPATSVITSRVRLCMSAEMTKRDIDGMIRVIDYVGTYLGLKIKRSSL